MMRKLKTVTFAYVQREDRILTAINAGAEDAWSCWLTRRLALAVVERVAQYIAASSSLAQRTPADMRGDMIAFEREAAIAKTAPAMSRTSNAVLKTTADAAALAERLTIGQQGNAYRLELQSAAEDGAAGLLKRAELQRLLQMLQGEIGKAAWLAAAAAKPQTPPAPAASEPKPARH